MNGSITADDAAATLQYVLTATGLSPQGVANVKAVLPNESEVTSVHAALIFTKCFRQYIQIATGIMFIIRTN